MNELFKLPERLPPSPNEVPMFRATRFRSMSSRDKEYQAALGRRLRDAQESFGMPGNPTIEGARLVLRSEAESLELYQQSDSLWWTHHGLSYQEEVSAGARLPDETRARELAASLLERYRLDAGSASVTSITYVEAARQKPGENPRGVRTAIDVNYGFTLVGHPVMGPGAKIRVTLAPGDLPAQLIYFWRVPLESSAQAVIGATTALERFMRDPLFYRLRDKEAVVAVHELALGYYAMSPTDFQRWYIPVWAIDATCQTRELQHDFRRYVVAVDKTQEEAKKDDLVGNPRACRMF